jgi:hypothetical protein
MDFRCNWSRHLEFFFRIKNPEDFLTIDLAKTTHGGVEIEAIDFVDLENTIILPRFLKQESLRDEDNLNEPVKFFFSNRQV